MQIVIDIPEQWEKCNIRFIRECIRNGTPLPKGHGRLIDADAITKDLDAFQDAFVIYTATIGLVAVVCVAPTIIEADKEVDE